MHLGRMNLDPSLPVKFAIGLFFMALSFVVMIYAVNLAMEVSPVGMQWLIITYLLQTWGELALSPIGLSAFSQYAQKICWTNVWTYGSWHLPSVESWQVYSVVKHWVKGWKASHQYLNL